MKTRFMNERITFFEYRGGMKDGQVIPKKRSDLFSCWCEVSKATIKEFQERKSVSGESKLQKSCDTKVFAIRHQQKMQLTSTMLIDFKGAEYKIIDVENDYLRKDILLVKGEVVA